MMPMVTQLWLPFDPTTIHLQYLDILKSEIIKTLVLYTQTNLGMTLIFVEDAVKKPQVALPEVIYNAGDPGFCRQKIERGWDRF